MPFIRIYNTNKQYKDLNYLNCNDSLRNLINKIYDRNINGDTHQLKVGNKKIFENWNNLEIRHILEYGTFLTIYSYQIKIFIIYDKTKKIEFDVDLRQSILSFKVKLRKHFNFKSKFGFNYFLNIKQENQYLKDNFKLLKDYDIKTESILYAESKKLKKNKTNKIIYIKMINGKEFQLLTNETDKIEEIKKKISKLEGVPNEKQQLIFKGMNLEDIKTLLYYGIENESIFYLVLRLRGGGVDL